MVTGPTRKLSAVLFSPWIYHPLRLFIGGLFLYTGATKLVDTAGFEQSIAAYGILPAVLLPCAAIGLPALEVVAGFGTLINRRWAILGTLAMMVLFTGVLGYGVATGLEIDCGCFSTGEKTDAQNSGTASILEIPGSQNGLSGEQGLVLEPIQPESADEGTCSEGQQETKSLWPAFIRDIFLLLGVVYLVAWPDMKRKV